MPDALIINDSILHITARKETANGYDYQSGMISSWGKFSQQYGRFEIRAKYTFFGAVGQSISKGYWPAIWFLPDDPEYYGTPPIHPIPEIDLSEAEGSIDYFMWHGARWSEMEGYTENVGGDNFNRNWHTYRMDWLPTGITFYVDDIQTGYCADPPNSRSMYLILNLAIAGTDGWPPAPDETTVFPGLLDIDYIKVWSL